MTMTLDDIFEGARVPGWLRRFDAEPDAALADLLLGRADLGMLQADEPVEILLDWLQGLGEKTDLRGAVDLAVSRWIGTAWGQPVLPNAAGSATLTAMAWCRAADLIAFDRGLPQSAAQLRERVVGCRGTLDVMTQSRARDPLGRALLAIGRYQQDRGLIDLWWQLSSLPPGERWYRGVYGVDGLRGLPSSGGFPAEVAEGLALLALALHGHATEGWLGKDVASREFHRVARLTMAAYPFPDLWLLFWREFVQSDRGGPVRAWIEELVRLDQPVVRSKGARQVASPRIHPDPAWADRAKAIAQDLRSHPRVAFHQAEALLHDQRKYAEATGDGRFLVRSACNFASCVAERAPQQALRWLTLAKPFEPWNAYVWTTTVKSFLGLRKLPTALCIALQAVERFPDNDVARNGLAEVLKAQERFAEAEAVYRDTIERFPNDDVSRTGLAEVLKAQERFDEAEAVYRDTIERFPDDDVARNGLAWLLFHRERLAEAEFLFRQTQSRFHDSYSRDGLRRTLEALERTGEIERAAEGVPTSEASASLGEPAGMDERAIDELAAEWLDDSPRYASAPATSEKRPIVVPFSTSPASSPRAIANKGLRSEDIEAVLADAYLLRRWGRLSKPGPGDSASRLRESARDLLGRLAVFVNDDARAVSEHGLLTLGEGEWDNALTLLREAARRFSGSARVKYALARAERVVAYQTGLRWDAEAESRVLGPWRDLQRVGEHFRFVHWLGEGRAWLALTDGVTVQKRACGLFGKLAHWVRWQIVQVPPRDEALAPGPQQDDLALIRTSFTPAEGADPFFGWWAGEVQTYVFGREMYAREEDIRDMATVVENVRRNASVLDQIEEEYVYRFARV